MEYAHFFCCYTWVYHSVHTTTLHRMEARIWTGMSESTLTNDHWSVNDDREKMLSMSQFITCIYTMFDVGKFNTHVVRFLIFIFEMKVVISRSFIIKTFSVVVNKPCVYESSFESFVSKYLPRNMAEIWNIWHQTSYQHTYSIPCQKELYFVLKQYMNLLTVHSYMKVKIKNHRFIESSFCFNLFYTFRSDTSAITKDASCTCVMTITLDWRRIK